MRWAHAAGDCAVMTTLTSPDDFRMINGRIGNNPVAVRRVARATDVRRIDVSRAFTTPVFATVMAIGTNLRTNLRRAVCKLCRFPSHRCMATATGIRRWNVRQPHAPRLLPVVATLAGTVHLRMVHTGIRHHPVAGRRMAGTTRVCRINM